MGRPSTRQWVAAAAVSAISLGFLADPLTTFGQSSAVRLGRKPAVPTSPSETSGFEKSVRQLMEQARREAAAGNVESAIKSSQRAMKIAEAAAPLLGASPDCSPAAAEQLHRELLALRPSTSGVPVVPAPTAVTDAPSTTPPTTHVEQWQAPVKSEDNVPSPVVARIIARPRVKSVEEEVYFPLEAPAEIEVETRATSTKPAVVLKRPQALPASTATELPVAAAAEEHAVQTAMRPERGLPVESVANADAAEPDWMRSDAAVERLEDTLIPHVTVTDRAALHRSVTPSESAPREAAAFVEMTVVPAKPEWETPQITPKETAPASVAPARALSAHEWTSSGAVYRKQRIARNESLHGDGWESTTHVTRAGGLVLDASDKPAASAVATTAFRASTETGLLSDARPPLLVAPLPPEDFDEDDVTLHAPSVWKRDGLATVTSAEPKGAESPRAWRQFSAWAKSHNWTPTAALMGLVAAVLALAAFVLALIPREGHISRELCQKPRVS